MNLAQPVFLAFVFLVFALVTYVAIRQLMPTPAERRFEALGTAQAAGGAAASPQLSQLIARWLSPLAKPSLPSEGWEKTPLRVRFYNAGLRSVSAPIIYFGVKTLLTFVLPGLLMLAVTAWGAQFPFAQLLAMVLLMAAIGYYLPNAVLAQMVAHRQRE
jgi:tight adherence protein C